MTHIDLSRHEHYMRLCLDLAKLAVAEGNLGIGSLIVKDDTIIAKAGETLPNQPDVIGHAELLAIRQAGQKLGTLDLSDCILYTTAEPCWMCSYAVRETEIKLVVIGTLTPDVGGISTRYPLLSDASISGWKKPPQIITGILADECAQIRHTDNTTDIFKG